MKKFNWMWKNSPLTVRIFVHIQYVLSLIWICSWLMVSARSCTWTSNKADISSARVQLGPHQDQTTGTPWHTRPPINRIANAIDPPYQIAVLTSRFVSNSLTLIHIGSFLAHFSLVRLLWHLWQAKRYKKFNKSFHDFQYLGTITDNYTIHNLTNIFYFIYYFKLI